MFRTLPAAAVALTVFAATALTPTVPAAADDDLERVPPVTHAATLKECGECHLAFQPALLPAGSWRAIMANLKDHFGDNASLPAPLATEIGAYLEANAGRRGDPSIQRITLQRWFTREHHAREREGEDDDGWFGHRRSRESARAPTKVKSLADCAGCHARAAQGMYEDD